jgi:hypothetical protein
MQSFSQQAYDASVLPQQAKPSPMTGLELSPDLVSRLYEGAGLASRELGRSLADLGALCYRLSDYVRRTLAVATRARVVKLDRRKPKLLG